MRCDPADIARWYQKSVQRHGEGLASHIIESKQVRVALELLEKHDGFYEEKPQAVIIRGGCEELPLLQLQVGRVLARVPGVVTGNQSWSVVVPYAEFVRRASHVRFPLTLRFDQDRQVLIIETRSGRHEIQGVPAQEDLPSQACFAYPPEPGFAYPSEPKLLGYLNQSASQMSGELLAVLHNIWSKAYDWETRDIRHGHREIDKLLGSPCQILFVPGAQLDQGRIEIHWKERIWKHSASVYRPWDGWIPLEYVIWIGLDVLYEQPEFVLCSGNNLTIASGFWLSVVVAPLTDANVPSYTFSPLLAW